MTRCRFSSNGLSRHCELPVPIRHPVLVRGIVGKFQPQLIEVVPQLVGAGHADHYQCGVGTKRKRSSLSRLASLGPLGLCDVGDTGAAYSGAVEVAAGVWVYQITKNGLALQVTLQGTKYYKDDDLKQIIAPRCWAN
jgi:hypothetical protein